MRALVRHPPSLPPYPPPPDTPRYHRYPQITLDTRSYPRIPQTPQCTFCSCPIGLISNTYTHTHDPCRWGRGFSLCCTHRKPPPRDGVISKTWQNDNNNNNNNNNNTNSNNNNININIITIILLLLLLLLLIIIIIMIIHIMNSMGFILMTMTVSRSLCWRDAVRGARWGLEYPELLRDTWASELTSRIVSTRETVKTCSG